MSDTPAFDPHRFRAAAEHYRQGRAPYSPGLIRRVARAVGLRERHRVLDLGCGPGPLAIGFGYFAGEVLGLDPEPRMLEAAAEAAEGLVPNVAFRQGSSADLGPHLGPFRLVTMGRSFHWMDRPTTLRGLDTLIEAGGAIALFGTKAVPLAENDWQEEWRQITRRYTEADPAWQARRREGTGHDAVLLGSVFCRLERIAVLERRVSTVDSLVARALSRSSVSRLLDAAQTAQLAQELRASLRPAAPDGTVAEIVESVATIARR